MFFLSTTHKLKNEKPGFQKRLLEPIQNTSSHSGVRLTNQVAGRDTLKELLEVTSPQPAAFILINKWVETL